MSAHAAARPVEVQLDDQSWVAAEAVDADWPYVRVKFQDGRTEWVDITYVREPTR